MVPMVQGGQNDVANELPGTDTEHGPHVKIKIYTSV